MLTKNIWFLLVILSFSTISFAQVNIPCPFVSAGPDKTINCNDAPACATLTGSFFDTRESTSYTVETIPHTLPIAYGAAGGTGVSVNADDVWSPVINLPFPFCFYGQTYNSVIVGSNGDLSFNVANASSSCPYAFSNDCPSPSLVQAGQIFGVYHDVDPTVCGDIKWYMTGTSPCRQFVVVFNSLCHYTCNSMKSAHMIILNETTNYIDIYVTLKETCTNWNGGRAIVGIQNMTGTAGITAPNRNSNPTWTVSNSAPEAWRFKPAGNPFYTFQWYQGTNLIGNTTSVSVCPTQPTTYTAKLTYTSCANSTPVTLTDEVLVTPQTNYTISHSSTNVNCNGGNNGSINVNLTGGTAPFSFNWSNGATTQNLSNLTAGTYTLTVTDNSGCIKNYPVTITEPPILSLSTTSINVNCFGQSTGSIDLTVTGGTTPYTYLWNNSATTQDLSNLAAGTYSVTVTDSKGCQKTTSATVTQPTSALTTTLTGTNLTCNANSTGAITNAVSGGTSPYSYSWSNGATTQNVTNLAAGTYTVTITDTKGCQTTASKTLTQPAVLNLSTTSTDVTCFGLSTGSITTSATGGTTPYTYAWSNGATTASLSNIPAGTYNLNLTDFKGCVKTASVTITQPSAALSLTSTKTNVACFGNATGAIDLTVNGGTPNYTYLWNNGATTQDLNGLLAGTFSVTVTDSKGCQQTSSITITQPAGGLTVSLTGTNLTCNGNLSGSVTSSISSGTLPYSYAWSNGATSQNLVNVAAGTYTLTVTDGSGCQSTSSATLTQPAVLNISTTSTDVTCFGLSNGSITTSATGGTTPYSYAWSNGATTASLSNIPAGTYNLTLTDFKGCVKTASVTITQPSAALSLTSTKTNVACFGNATGAIDLTVNGGTPNYTYLWSNGATTQDLNGLLAGTFSVTVTDSKGCQKTSSITITQPAGGLTVSLTGTNLTCNGNLSGGVTSSISSGTLPYSYAWSNGATTQNLVNVAAGTYTLTVTDGTGCQSTSSATITQPAVLNLSTTSTDVTCFGLSTGSITTSATGGTTPYTYAWSNGATTASLSNIPAGTYNLTLTDFKGCVKTASVTITQPSAALSLTSTKTNVACFGNASGAIDLTVNGGTPNYTYLWNNGATTQDLNGLLAGTFSVTVTDSKGCQKTSSITITQPAGGLTVSLTGTNLTCNGNLSGGVTSSISSGTLPYSYAWSNGATTQNLVNVAAGTYTLTVTDGTGCQSTSSATLTQQSTITLSDAKTHVSCRFGSNGAINLNVSGGTPPYTYLWNNGVTTQDLSNLTAGTYSVTVTDFNGCVKTRTVIITQPAAVLAATLSLTNVNCFGQNTGNVDLTPSGGTAPYTYLWNTGATTQDLNNVIANTYSVTVTDIKGCQQTASGTVTQPIAALSTQLAEINLNCFNDNSGSITSTTSGGSLPYSYSWNNGATSQNLTSISAGTYTLTVTDQNGCQQVVSKTITEPTELILTTSHSNIPCFGQTNGSISSTVSGGIPPYTYAWNNGISAPNLTNLSAGNYVLTVTDFNGCSKVNSVTVSQPSAPLVLSSAKNNINCNGQNTGAIDLTATGGTAPLTYLWSNGAQTEDLVNLSAGVYTVTVTDNMACQEVLTETITEPTVLNLVLTGNNLSCNGNASGSITSAVSGGTPIYTYAWSTSATTSSISNLAIGTYTLTITDAAGCQKIASKTITQPTAVSLSDVKTHVSCRFGNNGAINLNVSGGTAPYTYLWNNGETTQDLSNLTAGTYSVTVTDFNGCVKTRNVIITQPAAVLAATLSLTNVNCFGQNTGNVDLTPSGGTAPYTYLWNTGATTQDLNNVIANTFSVTVTDVKGCQQTASGTVTQPIAALSTQLTEINLNCFNDNSGSITSTTSGGTIPYSYAWNNGATSQNLTSIPSGSYTLTVTDGSGCQSTSSATLTQPAALNLSTTSTDVPCFGLSNGSITTSATGGTTPYSYSWSNGATTASLSNIPAGTYNLTLTDFKGCVKTASVTITQPSAALSLNSTKTNVACFGNATGAIDLTVTGGTPNYTYLWSNGATTQDLNGLLAGTFSVTVTDFKGCQQTSSITITQPSGGLTVSLTGTNLTCNGNLSGGISSSTSGGTVPYSYAWSNGATSQNLVNVAAGTYTLTVTDGSGCQSTSSATLTQPTTITLSDVKTHVSCRFGNNGAINLNVSGGTAPFTYLWNNGETTQDLSNLTAGTYSVTVTDFNGCVKTRTVIITQPAAVLAAALSLTNVNCFGQNTGNVDLTPSGGTAPYSYLWNTGATTQDLNNVIANTYSVTVTDIKGCQQTTSGTVTEPAAPLQASLLGTDVLCFGQLTGSVDATISGGTMPYNYTWSTNAVTQDINNLGAGNYTLQVSDFKGCTTSNTITLVQPVAPLLATYNQQDPTCFGINNGWINVSTTGGTLPYTFTWNDGVFTEDQPNASAGTYQLNILDAHNCPFQINTTINQPPALQSTATTVDILCFGEATGSIDLSVNGGTGLYSYLWSNGALTQDISGLTAGTYSVTITDAQSCVLTTPITVNQPLAPLTFSETHTDALCQNGQEGSIQLTISGATAPYSVLWNNNQTTTQIANLGTGYYFAVVNDAVGCSDTFNVTINDPFSTLSLTETHQNVLCFGQATGSISVNATGGQAPYDYLWSTGGTDSSIDQLVSGNYFVNVTDDNNCSAFISAYITQPTSAIVLQTQSQMVDCFGNATGAINTTTSGGVLPYSYLWNNGATTSSIHNLVAGNYQLTLTDALGCQVLWNTTITEPTDLVLSANPVDALCKGDANGSIDLTVVGGVTPYSYLWNPTAITQDLSNLIAGTYQVQVTDSNGCAKNLSINITEPTAVVSITEQHQNISCFGGNDGNIAVEAHGGNGNYSYQWNTTATSTIINSLIAGTYNVTATDFKGCNTQMSITLTEPAAPLSLALSMTPVVCHGQTNGTATVAPTGGTAPYTYLWNNGATDASISQLVAGTYQVEVRDFNNCISIQSIEVTEPSAIGATFNILDVLCHGDATGRITVTPSGGTAPFTYLWSTGGQSDMINLLTSAWYSVQLIDNNGCVYTDSAFVNQPSTSLSGTLAVVDNTCFGASFGSISSTISGGTAPYAYVWNNTSTTTSINNLPNGAYQLSVYDFNNCVLVLNDTITSPTAIVTQANIHNVSCFSGNNGSIQTTITGGVPPYNLLWNNSETTPDIINLIAGNYTLSVTDSNLCNSFISFSVTQPLLPLTLSSTQLAVDCFGNASGQIDLTVVGGTAPYSYNWSNGAISEDIFGLAAGNYRVIVTDYNNCTDSLNAFIFQPSEPLSLAETHQNVLCFGLSTGSIDLSVTGGSSPYNILWNNSITTEDLTNLPAGTYGVGVTDQNGCHDSLTVFITQPLAPLSISFNATEVGCYGDSSGALYALISGGTEPYTYNWNTGATTTSITDLGSGTFTFYVTDNNNCSTDLSIVVNQPQAPLSLVATGTQPTCFGYTNGQVQGLATGGTAPYNYQWNNGPGNAIWTPVGIGNYTLIVTDINGCTDTATVELGQPAQLQVAFDADVRIGCAPLEVTFTNLSDTQFGCVWQLGDGSTQQGCAPFTYSYAGAGSHDVQLTVTDANGCSNSLTMDDYITVYPIPYANIGVDQQILFPDKPVVNITNLSEGAVSYVWDLDDGLSGMTYFEPGNHTYTENTKDTFIISLIAKNEYGCVDTAYQVIIFRNNPVYWAPNTFIPDGDNINDVWNMVFSNPADVTHFRVDIFNRWGENIFTSTDHYQGWDGTYNGQPAQDGTYTWIVVFEWVDKRVFEARGHVNLLR